MTLLRERDFEDVSISEICKHAGVSNGNFYRYFRDKEDVLLHSYPEMMDYVLKEEIERGYASPLDAIWGLIGREVEKAYEMGPNVVGQLFRLQLRRNINYTFPKDEDRPYYKWNQIWVKRAQEAGMLHHSYDADDITHSLLRVVRGAAFDWAIQRGRFPLEEVIRKDISALLFRFASPKDADRHTS